MMNGSKHFACLNIFSFLTKTKTDENKDPNDYLPCPSKYDPNVDYYDLIIWKSYYESHKGEEFAEEVKKNTCHMNSTINKSCMNVKNIKSYEL